MIIDWELFSSLFFFIIIYRRQILLIYLTQGECIPQECFITIRRFGMKISIMIFNIRDVTAGFMADFFSLNTSPERRIRIDTCSSESSSSTPS